LPTKLPELVHGKNNLVTNTTTNHSLTDDRDNLQVQRGANAPPVFLLPKNSFSGYCIEKWGKPKI
jgi:hypothetical protein